MAGSVWALRGVEPILVATIEREDVKRVTVWSGSVPCSEAVRPSPLLALRLRSGPGPSPHGEPEGRMHGPSKPLACNGSPTARFLRRNSNAGTKASRTSAVTT